MSKITQRLAELGITLPPALAPVASYAPAVRTGNQLFVSGQIAMTDGVIVTGHLGADVSLDTGKAAARTCALNLLAQVEAAAGLDAVRRVVKVTVFVAATPDFTAHPDVANGASDLFVQVFGDAGRHARAAVGCASLPRGSAVEVEALFEIA